MTNEELIKALRYCADEDNICTRQTNCGYYGKGFFCQDVLLLDAADALEAAEQRIAELEAQLPKEGEWIIKDVLPDEHGDLIDRDELKKKKVYSHERHEYVVPVAFIDWEHAVIEAERQTE